VQIPNLLNMAMAVVGKQQFTYQKFVSREVNEIGALVPTYTSPQATSGQVQAAPRHLFELYGLDFQKTILIFYVSQDIIDIQRDVSGDKIQYQGATYQCLTETDWYKINGWKSIVAVKI
jgi:hypothetical protein